VVLVIREAQMREMTRVLLAKQIVDQLEEALPHRTKPLGPGALRSSVQHSMVRAREFGLADEQLTGYAALELVFGSDFSSDPQHSWAAEILRDRTLLGVDKLQRLREAATFRLAKEAEDAEWAEEQAKREAAMPLAEPEPDDTIPEGEEQEEQDEDA
jgi:hypothetical protein